jgi:hypothetical protein
VRTVGAFLRRVGGLTARILRPIPRLLGRVRWGVVLLVACFVFAVLEVSFLVVTFTGSGCNNCHIPQAAAEANAKTPHASVACLECHRTSGRLSLPLLNLQAAGNLFAALNPWSNSSPSQVHIDQTRCLGCHTNILGKNPPQGRDIKMSHKEPVAAGESCLTCHQTETHARDALSRDRDHGSCTGCHDGDKAPNACSVCHVREPSRDKTSLPGTEAVIHGANWEKAHGMGNMNTCTLCHATSFCKGCHGIDLPHARVAFPYVHGTEAIAVGNEVCTGCHAEKFCSSCHQIEMPHGATFLPEHSKITAKVGRATCDRCHVPDDCETCHEKHVHPGIPPDMLKELQGSK